MQRAIDGDIDLRLRVVGERDVIDGADRLAADEHLVSGHELAAGFEQQLVLIALVPTEQNHRDQHDGDDQSSESCDSGHDPSLSSSIRSLSLHSGTARAYSSLPTR